MTSLMLSPTTVGGQPILTSLLLAHDFQSFAESAQKCIAVKILSPHSAFSSDL